ncbi:uncharacterized protein LOC127839188 [Dreissena polymorpha]|nr:uncharacterized protein LOC127839188 [Dreissena polymorpha]
MKKILRKILNFGELKRAAANCIFNRIISSASGQSAVKYFARADVLYSPVQAKMVQNITNASGEYRHIIQRKKQEKDQVSKELTINTQNPPSKRTAMDMISHLAKRQRQDHVEKLDSVQTGGNKE